MDNNVLFVNSTNESLTSYIFINNAGSLRDKIPGTAHFLEHILAGPNEEKSRRIRQRMDDYLFSWNAETSLFWTKYFIDTSPHEEDIYLDYIKEFYRLLKAVKYKEEWLISCIEHEKKTITEEIIQTDTTDYKKYFSGLEMLYGKHGNTKPTGTVELISKIDINVLSDYVNDNYTKDNVFFVIYAPNKYKDKIVTEVNKIYKDLLSDNKMKLKDYLPENYVDGTIIPFHHNALNFRIIVKDIYTTLSKMTDIPETRIELMLMLIIKHIDDKFFKHFREELLLCYSCDFYQTIYGVFEFVINTKDTDVITHDIFNNFLQNIEIKEEDADIMLRKYRKKKQIISVGDDLGLAENIVINGVTNIRSRPSDWESVIYDLSTEIKNDDVLLKQQLINVSRLFLKLLNESAITRLVRSDV